MVSRKKILSRSRDDLTLADEPPPLTARFEEDVWYSPQKLFTDHVEEILKKWDSIDDEIWAKAIVMERNRRVAKAYARAPVLTINGGEGGFDGFRLGLNGFSNPMRDPKTEEFKEMIGLGAKVKMDECGNILIKRLSKNPVYVKSSLEENQANILQLPNGIVDLEKPLRVFDMRKFQQSINRELRRSNPDRVRLESQCVISVCFVKNEEELLDSPIWVLLINIVALEMLKAKLPPSSRVPFFQLQSDKRVPVSGSSDEDPYSLTSGHASSGSSNPKERREEDKGVLLKKEKDFFVPQNWSSTQDRRRDRSRDNFLDEVESATLKPRSNNRRRLFKKSEEKKKIVDDPYYCGFSARVPEFTKTPPYNNSNSNNFNNSSRDYNNSTSNNYNNGGTNNSNNSAYYNNSSNNNANNNISSPYSPVATPVTSKKQNKYRDQSEKTPKYREPGVLTPSSQSAPNLAQIPQVQPYWWQSRLYPSEQNRIFPEQSRRFQENLQGKGLGYNSGYFDNRLPYSFGNEFSSLQFSARVAGLPAGAPGGGRGVTASAGLNNPSTPATKPRRKFLSRQNMFKSS